MMQQTYEKSETKSLLYPQKDKDNSFGVQTRNERYRIIDINPTILCSNNHSVNHHPHHNHHSPSASMSSYGSTENSSPAFNRLKKKAWSFHGKSSNDTLYASKSSSSLRNIPSDRQELETLVYGVSSDHRVRQNINSNNKENGNQEPYLSIPNNGSATKSSYDPLRIMNASMNRKSTMKSKSSTINDIIFAFIYAMVNVIISVPALYGYSAVIFSDDCYQDHMNALSKLVIFSSAIHQIVFCFFSSLPFAIATVQDAGLIFLNTMSTKIARKILEQEEGGTIEEVVSTAMVLLSLSTASLGLVLVLLGYFRLAEYVSNCHIEYFDTESLHETFFLAT
jgi:hypothetical protein